MLILDIRKFYFFCTFFPFYDFTAFCIVTSTGIFTQDLPMTEKPYCFERISFTHSQGTKEIILIKIMLKPPYTFPTQSFSTCYVSVKHSALELNLNEGVSINPPKAFINKAPFSWSSVSIMIRSSFRKTAVFPALTFCKSQKQSPEASDQHRQSKAVSKCSCCMSGIQIADLV